MTVFTLNGKRYYVRSTESMELIVTADECLVLQIKDVENEVVERFVIQDCVNKPLTMKCENEI